MLAIYLLYRAISAALIILGALRRIIRHGRAPLRRRMNGTANFYLARHELQMPREPATNESPSAPPLRDKPARRDARLIFIGQQLYRHIALAFIIGTPRIRAAFLASDRHSQASSARRNSADSHLPVSLSPFKYIGAARAEARRAHTLLPATHAISCRGHMPNVDVKRHALFTYTRAMISISSSGQRFPLICARLSMLQRALTHRRSYRATPRQTRRPPQHQGLILLLKKRAIARCRLMPRQIKKKQQLLSAIKINAHALSSALII